jgi:hypothetical protein
VRAAYYFALFRATKNCGNGRRKIHKRQCFIVATWRAKAASMVTGCSLDCGHFLQGERPEETFEELQHFFGTV